MEKFELHVNYTVSDWVSVAIAYRKSLSNAKTFIIFSWIFVVVILLGALPPILIPLICLPFGTCTSEVLWEWARIVMIVIGACALLLFLAHTDILYRLRAELIYRIRFQKFKQILEETKKIIVSDEGLEIQASSSETKTYWNSFQQILESKDAFLLSQAKNHYILIPKRVFKDQDDTTRFAQAIIVYTSKQWKTI